MKKLITVCLTISLITVYTSCSPESVVEDAISEVVDAIEIPEEKSIEQETLELINNHRVSIGLNTLERNSVIKEQSLDHTLYMIEQQGISHDNFDERASNISNQTNFTIIGENVAAGYPNADAVVEGWLNSEGHRENIEGNYTHFDIAIEKDDKGVYYFTNIFAR